MICTTIRRLGRAAGACAVLAALAGPATAGGCQYAKIAELPVVFENNRVLIRAELNGAPVWFFLDTGAESSVLASEVAVNRFKLDVQQGAARFQGVGGERRSGAAQVRELKLDGAVRKNWRMWVLPLGEGEVRGVPIAGLIGRDFLQSADVEFDLAHDVVRLFVNQGCGGVALAYWSDTSGVIPLVDYVGERGEFGLIIKLNGRPVSALLDSGSPISVVTAAAARTAGVGVGVGVGASQDKVGGIGAHAIDTQTAVFDTLAIADEQVSHARLRVGDFYHFNKAVETGSRISTSSADFTSVLIGADFLRAHRVLLSNSQHKMYFTYNGGPIFQVVGPLKATSGSAVAATPPATPGAR